MRIDRRRFLAAGGLALAGLAGPRILSAAGPVEIRMRATERGEDVWFDPIGLWVPVGQTVRWIVERDIHTATAYHPANDRHSLRIPEGAKPWDSGFLTGPRGHFEITLTAEGVYDYFCRPHEHAGMVGRIVVGRPSGPGTLPFDYFKKRTNAKGWEPVPEAAQKAFPAIDRIVRAQVVRRAEKAPG